MEKLSEAASRVVIARPRRGRGNLGKALPEWERHRRPYTLPGLTVAALSERLAGWQSLRHAFCGARLSDLSLRGRYAPVAISQHNGR